MMQVELAVSSTRMPLIDLVKFPVSTITTDDYLRECWLGLGNIPKGTSLLNSDAGMMQSQAANATVVMSPMPYKTMWLAAWVASSFLCIELDKG
jgi:hypothetical protein